MQEEYFLLLVHAELEQVDQKIQPDDGPGDIGPARQLVFIADGYQALFLPVSILAAGAVFGKPHALVAKPGGPG